MFFVKKKSANNNRPLNAFLWSNLQAALKDQHRLSIKIDTLIDLEEKESCYD